MRDPARIDRIIGKLRKLWHSNPDMRLGQLVVNLTETHVRGCTDVLRVFNVEDDDLENAIDDTHKGGWT